jgi:hypothetical protein
MPAIYSESAFGGPAADVALFFQPVKNTAKMAVPLCGGVDGKQCYDDAGGVKDCVDEYRP